MELFYVNKRDATKCFSSCVSTQTRKFWARYTSVSVWSADYSEERLILLMRCHPSSALTISSSGDFSLDYGTGENCSSELLVCMEALENTLADIVRRAGLTISTFKSEGSRCLKLATETAHVMTIFVTSKHLELSFFLGEKGHPFGGRVFPAVWKGWYSMHVTHRGQLDTVKEIVIHLLGNMRPQHTNR